MNATTETNLHYLVVDVRDGQPILVFLGSDPAADDRGGPRAEPVQLQMLAQYERFGRPGRPTFGRPVLGKARSTTNRFREFSSAEDLWEAGFLPVPCYRVCDDWFDYHQPWTAAPDEDYTADGSQDGSV